MGKNADHVRELREQAQRRILIRDGGAGLQATPNGRAAKVTNVKDVRVDEKGNLIVTKRDDFIGEGGNVAGIGNSNEVNAGRINANVKVTDAKGNETKRGTIGPFVSGVTYDSESHQLVERLVMIGVSNGVLSVSDAGTRVITTAVEETVVS